MTASDQELLERWVAQRDAEAFKDLTKRHAGMVFATCRRILGNDSDAEDVAQECFAALLQAGRVPGGYLGPWLHLVATRRSLKWIRTESRRRRREAAQREIEGDARSDSDTEVLALVDAAIAQLPEQQRGPIVAYFFEDQTQETIAGTLGLTRQAVAYRIRTGVEAIRASLHRAGVTASAAAISAVLAREASAGAPPALSVRLGKLAISGPSAPGSAAVSGSPLIAFLAASAKLKVAAGLGLLLFLLATMYLGRTQPPSPPSPKVIPLADAREHDGIRNNNPGAATEAETSAADPAPDMEGEAVDGRDTTANLAVAATSEPDGKDAGVAGYVVDEGAFAIAGATVSLATTPAVGTTGAGGPGSVFTATTDVAGRYEINGLPAQQVYVSAYATGYRTASASVALEAGQMLNSMNFTLPEGVELAGIVLTDDAKPVAGAVVAPLGAAGAGGWGSGGGYHNNIGVTDAEGAFAIGFQESGIAALKVSAAEHGSAVFTEVPVGQDSPVELRMDRAPSLAGAITKENGDPAAGLLVELRGQFSMAWNQHGNPKLVSGTADMPSTMTDSGGRYAFPSLAANARYTARVMTIDGHGQALSFEHDLGIFEPGGERVWDHQLRPMIRVYGAATGAQTGKPVTNIRVSYLKGGEYTEGGYLSGSNRYELRLFEPGDYTIFPEFGFESHESAAAEAAAYGVTVSLLSAEERELNFKLPDFFTLSIRVVDQADQPIPGATISWLRVRPDGAPSIYGQGTTDDEGRHSNDFFPGLESRFHIAKAGYASTHTSPVVGEPGKIYPEETVTLYATGGIEGIAADAGGRPLAGVELKVAFRAEGVTYSHRQFMSDDQVPVVTGADGAFAIGGGFPAVTGDVHVYLHLDDNEWIEMAVVKGVEVVPGEVTHIGTVTQVLP